MCSSDLPYRAQQKAADRLKRPKPRKAAEGTRLWDEIAAGLRRHWSPEQIANRLRLDFPDNGDMHASVETIYQAIYLQARGELKQELKRAMRQGRTARRPQGGQGRKPRFREPMAMISERPPECVCSIESGPCERVDVFHVSGRFWSTSACGEKRTPARPAWTSFPS